MDRGSGNGNGITQIFFLRTEEERPTEATHSVIFVPGGGTTNVRLATVFSAACTLSMPFTTALTSFASCKYGGVATIMFRSLVIAALPRDWAPRPRYCESVIVLPLGAPAEPSTRAVHCSWRSILSGSPEITSQNMGPMLGADWARMPERESRRLVRIEDG
jgi:hypothetical protein